MNRKWLVICLIAVALLALSCAPKKSPGSTVPTEYASVRILGTSLGSTMSTAAMVYATAFNKFYPEIQWSSASGASTVNTIYLTKGTVALAMLVMGGYIDAYGFDKIPESRLRSLHVPTPPMQYVFAIPEDKPWTDISQVPKGVTMYPGTPGTASVKMVEAWLELAGLSKKDFNWVPAGRTEMVDAWKAGKVDIAQISPAGMAPYLMDMQTSARKFKLMGLSPELAAKATAGQVFERVGYSAPVKTNLTELAPEVFKNDVLAPQAASLLVSRDDFPEQLAYDMARILDEHAGEVSQMYSAMKYATPQRHIEQAKAPLDLHSGVARYYKEKGYLK